MAVLYAKPGQEDINEIWKNKPPSDSGFYKFLDSIGEKVALTDDWKGYRGEFGTAGPDKDAKAYYQKWNDVEFIFHIGPLPLLPFMNSLKF